LRLNRGVDLSEIVDEFGSDVVERLLPIIKQLESDGLVTVSDDVICLTSPGRLLSNEVFQRFLKIDEVSAKS